MSNMDTLAKAAIKVAESTNVVAGVAAIAAAAGFANAKTPDAPAHSAVEEASKMVNSEEILKEKLAVKFFQTENAGWTPEQAKGIVFALHRESGLNPQALGANGVDYGIGQWGKAGQAEFAKKFGHPIQTSTLTEQLEFANYQLTDGSGKKAGQALRNTHTFAGAADVASNQYIRGLATNTAHSEVIHELDQLDAHHGNHQTLKAGTKVAEKATGVTPESQHEATRQKAIKQAATAPVLRM